MDIEATFIWKSRWGALHNQSLHSVEEEVFSMFPTAATLLGEPKRQGPPTSSTRAGLGNFSFTRLSLEVSSLAPDLKKTYTVDEP